MVACDLDSMLCSSCSNSVVTPEVYEWTSAVCVLEGIQVQFQEVLQSRRSTQKYPVEHMVTQEVVGDGTGIPSHQIAFGCNPHSPKPPKLLGSVDVEMAARVRPQKFPAAKSTTAWLWGTPLTSYPHRLRPEESVHRDVWVS